MQTAANRAQGARIELYRKTGKIHPRSVTGSFNGWRWAMVWFTQILFYGGAWLNWGERQALLFDIAERKFYVFGLVLWPQDALLFALLLIIAATALFLVTAVAGRLFCGFACPQTVYTSVFRWIETRIEGDHLARLRLDQSPPSARKLGLKGAKHLAWLAIAGWTGITFVGYFTPIRELLTNLGPGELGPWEGFWVFFYSLFTYVQAGFAREMVCLHMCPYARFQSVMFDHDTVTISYDAARGEPRGRRGAAKSATQALAVSATSTARGDCVDCTLCVQVCPTGIDIRDGLQYQCINCGLCADACDDVMVRVGSPTGLIRMASEHELAIAPAAQVESPARSAYRGALRRPRAVAYAIALAAFSILGAWMVANRPALRVDVLRDRNALLRESVDGSIENAYTLKLMNLREAPRAFRVAVDGAAGVRIIGDDTFTVDAGRVLPATVTVAAAPAAERRGSQPIRFHIEALDDPAAEVTEHSTFLLP
ncbi:cytochrome c oxidase accessory protein CcoG [Aromatoleum diolicum]|uniref:Cytochrome c oxidase accessory protein CcoG n=1 Tax=Aromatoleum diolicum TaxID=75796 RepID=A0ABX1QHH7_9RHOO|nr:cytochrome c oxidase accessory protein CcoG [Aromatoleum diolicum]NMG76962.1 cytochrome c oxidase accessory protein CcoG [Aromatoleum diolicum]